jgi:hypothetical protein
MAHLQENIDEPWRLAGDTVKLTVTVSPLYYHPLYDDMYQYSTSNKALVPEQILTQLSGYDNIKYPLTIRIGNSLLGVHEITPEPMLYIPTKISQKNGIEEPQEIEIEIVNTEIAKAEFIKLKPHSSKFYEIADTKGFLESEIKRLYTHLEKEQQITLYRRGTPFLFDVIETLPESVVSLNETDVEVDFEKAHDYVEPPKIEKYTFKRTMPAAPAAAAQEPEQTEKTGFIPFSGKGHRLGSS